MSEMEMIYLSLLLDNNNWFYEDSENIEELLIIASLLIKVILTR
jgi:hypothetical protein